MPSGNEKQLEGMKQTIAALKQALDLVTDAVVITDTAGSVVYQNAASKELHQTSEDGEVTMMLANEHDEWRMADHWFRPVEKSMLPLQLARQEAFGPRDFLIKNENATFIAAHSGRPVKGTDGQTASLVLVINNVRTFNQDG
jgi:PAS domain-containing protein